MRNTQIVIDAVISRCPKNQLWQTPITGLYLHHADSKQQFTGFMQKPSLCVVLQGERQIRWGQENHRFGCHDMMFCPVNVPLIGQITDVPKNEPYLALSLQLDLLKLANINRQLALPPQNKPIPQVKWSLDEPIFNGLIRLIDLLNFPDDIEFLAPLVIQEIYYHLLKSKQGAYLSSLFEQNSPTAKIAQATAILEKQFDKPLSMQSLAMSVGMSVSGFYQHFKDITQLSPLQYQKRLRLNHAKRQLAQGNISISQIAYQVGYESPNQFSREYKRYFGVCPRQDTRA